MGELTLMAVHAHPDDEATSTGGTLARYADEGVRTVLVTCTDGRCGNGPAHAKPGDAGHDPDVVAVTRAAELARACEILRVTHLESLGYHDSGMAGWAQNDEAGSFWSVPVEESAARLAALMERYRPQVVVTYDQNGFYGHPDHIQANRIAHRAAEMTGIPDKLYYTAIGYGEMGLIVGVMQEFGIAPPQDFDMGSEGDGFSVGVPDDQITTTLDVGRWVDAKRDAQSAHASQADVEWFLTFPPEAFRKAFGREQFVRAFDRTGTPTPEDDLFAGLR